MQECGVVKRLFSIVGPNLYIIIIRVGEEEGELRGRVKKGSKSFSSYKVHNRDLIVLSCPGGSELRL